MSAVKYIRKAIMYSTVGAGVYGFRKSLRVGEYMEIDGGIASGPLGIHRAATLPTDFIEKVSAKSLASTNENQVINTTSLFGDNGSLYRRMDFTFFDDSSVSVLPFQTLMKCKNEVEEDDDRWMHDQCIPDYRHVLPFYLRNMCKPLVIAEKCLGLLKKDKPSRALVVGLGGGAFPGLLQELYPNMSIDIVELEPQVVNHAITYFGFKPRNNKEATTTITVQDATLFLSKKSKDISDGISQPYDIAIVDMFVDGTPPVSLNNSSFYTCLDSCLSPLSCTGIHLNSRDRNNVQMWKAMELHYGSKSCVLRGNAPLEPGPCVVFTHKGWSIADPLNLSLLRLLYIAREWSFEHKLPFDVSRRMSRSATPFFSGMENKFHLTREQQTADIDTSLSHQREIESLRQELYERKKSK